LCNIFVIARIKFTTNVIGDNKMKNSNLYYENNAIWPTSDQNDDYDESEFESAYDNQVDDETTFDERKPKPKQQLSAKTSDHLNEISLQSRFKNLKKSKHTQKTSHLAWSD